MFLDFPDLFPKCFAFLSPWTDSLLPFTAAVVVVVAVAFRPQHHPLMVKERAGSSVRPLQLAYMIYGGRAAFERKTKIQAQMEADPTFDK